MWEYVRHQGGTKIQQKWHTTNDIDVGEMDGSERGGGRRAIEEEIWDIGKKHEDVY